MANRARVRATAAAPEGGPPADGPPGGSTDLLAGIGPPDHGPQANGAPHDPFASFSAPAAPVPLTAGVPAGAAPSAADDPFASFAPTAVQGLDSLKNVVNQGAIERAITPGVAASLPDPIVHGALQDIQVKLSELLGLKTLVAELVTLTNTTARQVHALEKTIDERTDKSRESYAGVQAVLNEVVNTLASFQKSLPTASGLGANAASVTPVAPPPVATPRVLNRPQSIISAIIVAAKSKWATDPGFVFTWTNQPATWFGAFQGICVKAGMDPAPEHAEIKAALESVGMLSPDRLLLPSPAALASIGL